jgi:outer membrane murein-binding lipoprotein Lpp
MNISRVVAIVFGALLVAGVVKSSTDQPCTVNDKLMAMVADQDKKITDMMVEAKKEADDTKKKYEQLVTELEQKGCKK